MGMQHPFQLYQQKNPLYTFYTCDLLARNAGDSKKKMFYPRLLA